MNLHQNKPLFVEIVSLASRKMQIPKVYIEKDYWVTFALHTIFKHEIGEDMVFKGGTSLAKCYDLIERFSEDIDLVVLRKGDESNNKLSSKIKKISEVINEVLPEISIDNITHKMGMNRKTAHFYTKEFEEQYGQIRDVIIIEATWLGYFEPYTTRKVNSFIGEILSKNNQDDLAKEYELLPFEVRVLEPTRTICEKIMSLVRFSYSNEPLEDLKRKIRHIYDLHQLLQQNEFLSFFNSTEFNKMLLKVANDDVLSFKNNNQWLKFHPKEAIMFSQLESIWTEMKPTYNGSFKNLVYGNLPKEEIVFSTLTKIKERLSSIIWNIDL
jgi:Nucleotidyl transferase AbiEii toxin, Type IV TA system